MAQTTNFTITQHTWTKHMERISEADSIHTNKDAFLTIHCDSLPFATISFFASHSLAPFFLLICWHFNLTFAVGVKGAVEKCAKTQAWKISNHEKHRIGTDTIHWINEREKNEFLANMLKRTDLKWQNFKRLDAQNSTK